MTTIITRLYADRQTAEHVAGILHAAGLSGSDMDIVTRDGDDPAAQMGAARMGRQSAAAYGEGVARGHALLVVRAPFNPMGAARRITQMMDETPSHKVGLARESEYIRETLKDKYWSSILTDHPRFFSQDIIPGFGGVRGTVSGAFGFRLLSAHRDRRSAGSYHILPGAKVSAQRTRTSAISGGGTPLSSLLGWRTISKRS